MLRYQLTDLSLLVSSRFIFFGPVKASKPVSNMPIHSNLTKNFAYRSIAQLLYQIIVADTTKMLSNLTLSLVPPTIPKLFGLDLDLD